MENLTTKQLYENLLTLNKVLYLLEHGLFPGMAHKDISESFEYVLRIHTKYLDEFKKRSDRTLYDPNIDKLQPLQGIKGAQ